MNFNQKKSIAIGAYTYMTMKDVLGLDFSNAFDKISHSLLVLKLQHYDITGYIYTETGRYRASSLTV